MTTALKQQSVKTSVYFFSQLPHLKTFKKKLFVPKNQTAFAICDHKVFKWVKKILSGCVVYKVKAGEPLKNLKFFASHAEKILKKAENKKISWFVSVGGGTVGDFTGFFAGIYKRGCPVIHIPTTWLSAMDSAYGGKTALNFKNIKNIFGSYVFPQKVFIFKELLKNLPKKEIKSAKGELIKTALLAGGKFYKKLIKTLNSKNPLSEEELWRFLPLAVNTKLKIVTKDPFEKKNLRIKLNFGHTIGHILEANFKMAHGEAVLYGIVFALQWSIRRFDLSKNFLKDIDFLTTKKNQLSKLLKKIPDKKFYSLLLQDKKRINNKEINFVFIKGPGQLLIKKTNVEKIILEIKRQRGF